MLTDQRASKGKQGFASMSPEQRRALASKGGKSVPSEKRSFSQNRSLAETAGRRGGQKEHSESRSFTLNRELASEAGRKGGKNVPDEKRSFSKDRELAVAAGRKGGSSRIKRTQGQSVD